MIVVNARFRVGQVWGHGVGQIALSIVEYEQACTIVCKVNILDLK